MNVNQSWNAPVIIISYIYFAIYDYMLKQVLLKNVGHFGCEKLELSFVYFFGTFRKSYIGDNSPKVFGKLSENLAIHDQTICFGCE